MAYVNTSPVVAFHRAGRPLFNAALAMCEVRAAACPARIGGIL